MRFWTKLQYPEDRAVLVVFVDQDWNVTHEVSLPRPFGLAFIKETV